MKLLVLVQTVFFDYSAFERF